MTTATKAPKKSKKPASKAKPSPREPKVLVVEGGATHSAVVPAESIDIASIQIDDKPDRLNECLDAEKIDQLATTMARVGLLQPIMLTKLNSGKYRLVFGRRRLMAAKRLAWTVIPAHVVRGQSEGGILEAREIENLQRLDLNPMEESLAVTNLFELFIGDPHKSALKEGTPEYVEARTLAVKKVAERLAKPESWVRDRLFLARLSGKSRKLVLSGALPLAHAREISKLADPKMRDDLAERSASGGKGFYARSNPMELKELRGLVGDNLYSLAQVPWRLDAKFAEAPPCEACPCNSANLPGLFDHGAEFKAKRAAQCSDAANEPKAGVCTNHECFKRKIATANRMLPTVVRRVEKLAQEKDHKKAPVPELVMTTMNLDGGEFLKPAVAVERVEAARSAAKEKPSRSGGKVHTHAPAKPDPRRQAEHDHQMAMRDYLDKRLPDLERKLCSQPGGYAALMVFVNIEVTDRSRTMYPDAENATKAAASPEMDRAIRLLIQRDWAGLVELEQMRHPNVRVLDTDSWSMSKSGLGLKLLQACGIDTDGAPKLETFLEAAKVETAKEKQPAAAKAPAKKPKGGAGGAA